MKWIVILSLVMEMVLKGLNRKATKNLILI